MKMKLKLLPINFEGFSEIRSLLENTDSLLGADSVDTLFNRMIFYIDSQPEKQKKILTTKLAWSLSDVESEDNFLEDILKYIKAQEIAGL